MKKVLVTGASGFIGSYLVQQLTSKNYHVRCFVRKTSSTHVLSTLPNVEIVQGDMKDQSSIEKAVEGVVAIYHLAASTSEKSSSSKESYKTNVEGAKDLVQSCNRHRVKRLIIISSQSTKRKKQGNYGYTKKEADKIFEQSTLSYTILKPTLVYGKGSKGLFTKIIKLVKKLPLIPIIGKGDYKLQPTYVQDLTTALVDILDNEKTFRKTYDIAGETRLTFTQLITITNKTLQKEKKLIHIPFWLCYNGIKLLSLITKNPPVTTDNLLGLIQETTIDLQPAKNDFNYSPLSFEEGIKKTIWNDTSDPTKKNIGFIGMGKMGVLHASLINHLPNAQITGLFDVNKKIRPYLNSLNISAPFFTDLDQFFKQSALDAVFISVPPSFTLPTIQKAIQHNIPFFVEKPLANNLSNAQKILNLSNQKKLPNTVGYMYRYIPTIQKAKKLIDDKVLGNITHFEASAYVTQVLSKKKGWRYSKATAGGGCVSLHGTHLLYMLYYFFGTPKKISSKLHFPYSEVEDKADINFSYDDFKGDVSVSWSEKDYPKLTLRIVLTGKNGTLDINSETLRLDLKEEQGNFKKGTTIVSNTDLTYSDFQLGGDGYYDQDLNFITSLEKKEQPKVTVQDAFLIQKILGGIYESHEKKSEVTL